MNDYSTLYFKLFISFIDPLMSDSDLLLFIISSKLNYLFFCSLSPFLSSKLINSVSFYSLDAITKSVSSSYCLVVDKMHLFWSLILNSVPIPIWLLQEILPPIYVIICLQMDSPSPVPPLFYSLFSSIFLKFTNSFFTPSFEIPLPLSITFISNEINLFG